jgi:glycerol-3-phosphate dehydrogenase
VEAMSNTSSQNRANIVTALQKETLDVLVIGGGITGAGISLDATKRGLKTGLVEMQDFAAGTSSRSTKLVHGGLRYLKQFEIGLVAEVGKERAIVYENGPHITTPEWMMLPFYKGGTFGPISTNLGLRVYDFLAGVKRAERRKMLKADQALAMEPLLQENGLKGAGFYVEYKTDDARLTIEVLKKSIELGTIALNYIKVVELLYDEHGKVNGVVVEDQSNQDRVEIFAKKIINAAGPWVDELRGLDGSKQGKTLQLTKGAHLVFSKEVFPLQQAIYFDTHDKRMIFAIPRGDKTYVGTTDTTFHDEIAHPKMTKEDRDYLLAAINGMFPILELTSKHIESNWVGVRPLIAEEGKDPSEISRKDEIFISESGLYSMAGGKLTGYRKMAEEVVDKIVIAIQKEEGILFEASSTKHLPLSGGDVGGSLGFVAYKEEQLIQAEKIGIHPETAAQLIGQYGSNVETIFEIYQDCQKDARKKQIDPIVLSELIYAIDYELAYTPADFFIRRTGSLFFDIDWVETHQAAVTQYMADFLGWSEPVKQQYEAELQVSLEEAKLTNLK